MVLLEFVQAFAKEGFNSVSYKLDFRDILSGPHRLSGTLTRESAPLLFPIRHTAKSSPSLQAGTYSSYATTCTAFDSARFARTEVHQPP